MSVRYMYNDIEYTEHFTCPITNRVFTNPVIASDAYTYEKNALTALLQTPDPVSPKTGERLNKDVIVPNLFLDLFMKKCRIYYF